MEPTQPSGSDPNVPQGPTPSHASSPAVGQDPILVTIGDIGVTRHWIVTPNGTAPLAGSTWIARDMTRTETKIPAYAIVLAIIFFLACLLGLLFLLIKERVTTGYVEVTVQSGPLYHVTQVPISSEAQIPGVRGLVHQAQSLASAAQA